MTPRLRSCSRNTSNDFFEKYYVPGNITMTIVGDVNPADAKRLAERYFVAELISLKTVLI